MERELPTSFLLGPILAAGLTACASRMPGDAPGGGGLDENRVSFTNGRDIRIPGAAGEPANYSIHAHVEVDGKPHDRVETRFSFRDL